MDTAVNFPKDFQTFLVVGLVEDLVSLARSHQRFCGVVVTGTETAHGFVCIFCLQFQFYLPAFPEQLSVLGKTHRILKKILLFQHTRLDCGLALRKLLIFKLIHNTHVLTTRSHCACS